MNRRSFLKSLGAIAAAAYAVPAVIDDSHVAVALPSASPEAATGSISEWHSLVRVLAEGATITADQEAMAAQMAFDECKAGVDRKCKEGYRVVEIKWAGPHYNEMQCHWWLRCSAILAKI